MNIKKDCFLINGVQNIKLEKGFIGFKNFNKQIPDPFKIYAYFECLLKSVDCDGFDNECFFLYQKISRPCSL